MLGLLSMGGCKSRQLTTPTIQMDIESRFWVRVLLLDDVSSCALASVSPLSVGKDRTVPRKRTTEIRLDKVDVPISIKPDYGRIRIAGHTFTSNEVVIFPDDPYIFNLNGNDYRGNLRLIANPDGKSFDAINLVPPEPYLAGVVGAEMPDYWEAEALEAQAIAARTYCFYIKKRFGVNRTWDVKQTAANQVYRGRQRRVSSDLEGRQPDERPGADVQTSRQDAEIYSRRTTAQPAAGTPKTARMCSATHSNR